MPKGFQGYNPGEQFEMFDSTLGEVPLRNYKEDKENAPHGVPDKCFGYISGKLYVGDRHHMAIMDYLISNGMDWDELENAPQIWGWAFTNNVVYSKGINDNTSWGTYPIQETDVNNLYEPTLRFSTDAGKLDMELADLAKDALERYFGMQFRVLDESWAPEYYAESFNALYGEEAGEYRYEPVEVDVFSSYKPWKLATFAEIKFVSLPDRLLVGENTYHAHLLTVEFGKPFFPHSTLAIGRAFVRDDVVTEVSFDFVFDPGARRHAELQLEEYAEEQGYLYDPQDRGIFHSL